MPGNRIQAAIDDLLLPWNVVAGGVDFYARNRTALRATVARTNAQTVWGARNSREILSALSKQIGRIGEGYFYLYPQAILAMADDDAEPLGELLDGKDYEITCKRLLESDGFQVSITPASGDMGVDLLVEGHGYRIAVQCKDWKKPVGVKAVQEVFAGARHYQVDYAIVVANGGYTRAAEEMAGTIGVLLLNSSSLVRLSKMLHF